MGPPATLAGARRQTEAVRVVEWFIRVGPDTLDVTFTVDAPGTLSLSCLGTLAVTLALMQRCPCPPRLRSSLRTPLPACAGTEGV